MEFAEDTSFHLVGIGGIGVSGVARILHQRGYEVSGSDVRESSITEALRDESIEVAIGHVAEHVEGADVVVTSTAIPDDNVELEVARERGIRVVHRSEVLHELVRHRRVIGVTGTHGKGTVASMIAWILEVSGRRPGFAVGGMSNNFGTNARDTEEDWFVLEIDESDGSHHNFSPDYAVCNFLEVDHLNYYDGLEDIIDSMVDFFEENGRLKEGFLNLDCDGNRELARRVEMRPTGYGTRYATEFAGELQGSDQLPIEFEAFHRNDRLGSFELDLPGLYNVVNAMGAIAVTSRIGVSPEAIREGLATYEGMENRFTISRAGGVQIVKDYVSHPTGIEKVLESARDLGEGRLISVFKPYRYTLIDYLKDEYGEAFEESDEAVITEMYAADEDPIPGVDTQTVVDKIEDFGVPVDYVPDESRIKSRLHEKVEPGDIVVIFGGDDFFEMAEQFEAELAGGQGETTRETRPESQPRVDGPLAD